MSSIYERAEAAISPLGFPYAADEYIPDSQMLQLPDQFIVYQLIGSPGVTWADGKETGRQYRVQFSFFTRDGTLFNTAQDQIEAAVIAAGFTGGGWTDFPYFKDTRHFGCHADFYYYERR